MYRIILRYVRYFGLVAVGLEWLAVVVFWVVSPEYFDGRYPLSWFATLPETRLAFALLFAMAALLFWLFVRHYLSHVLRVPLTAFAVSMSAMALVGTMPLDFDVTVTVILHYMLVGIFVVSFGYGMFMTGHRTIHRALRHVSNICVIVGVLLLIGYLTTQKGDARLLYLELGTILSCQIWTVYVSISAWRQLQQP